MILEEFQKHYSLSTGLIMPKETYGEAIFV